jgi:hypothetical protein
LGTGEKKVDYFRIHILAALFQAVQQGKKAPLRSGFQGEKYYLLPYFPVQILLYTVDAMLFCILIEVYHFSMVRQEYSNILRIADVYMSV